MADNGYRYILAATDGTSLSELASQGYEITNTCTDGAFCIVDKKSSDAITLTTNPALPAYVVESISDPQNMTHDEAKQVIAYLATSEGGSDGWYYRA